MEKWLDNGNKVPRKFEIGRRHVCYGGRVHAHGKII